MHVPIRFYVMLGREDMTALTDLATANCRPVREQAIWLLHQAIRREDTAARRRDARRPGLAEAEAVHATAR